MPFYTSLFLLLERVASNSWDMDASSYPTCTVSMCTQLSGEGDIPCTSVGFTLREFAAIIRPSVLMMPLWRSSSRRVSKVSRFPQNLSSRQVLKTRYNKETFDSLFKVTQRISRPWTSGCKLTCSYRISLKFLSLAHYQCRRPFVFDHFLVVSASVRSSAVGLVPEGVRAAMMKE